MSSSLPRFLLRALGLTAIVGALAWVVVGAVRGSAEQGVVPWAAGVSLLGALLGHLAGGLVPSGRPESAAQAALVALGVRLMATAGLALVALQTGVSPAATFAIVLGTMYLALLVLEVARAVAEVSSASAPRATPTHSVKTPHDDGSGAPG